MGIKRRRAGTLGDGAGPRLEWTGNTNYHEAALQALHFICGRNPINRVFVSGYGDYQHSSDFYYQFWTNLLYQPPGYLGGNINVEGRDVVLQHGSILCGPAHRKLADLLRLPDESTRDLIRADLREKTTDLDEVTGAPVDIERLADCVRQGFAMEWGVEFTGEGATDANEVPDHVSMEHRRPGAV